MKKGYVIKTWDELGDHIIFILSDEKAAKDFCDLPLWAKLHEIVEYEEADIDPPADKLVEYIYEGS